MKKMKLIYVMIKASCTILLLHPGRFREKNEPKCTMSKELLRPMLTVPFNATRIRQFVIAGHPDINFFAFVMQIKMKPWLSLLSLVNTRLQKCIDTEFCKWSNETRQKSLSVQIPNH